LAGILGILGDALSAYGGQQPIFGPAMYQKQRDKRAEQADLEKFRTELAARQQEPSAMVKTLQDWIMLPDPLKQQYVNMKNITDPITVSTPQGTQLVSRSMNDPNTRTLPDGRTFHNINGQWFEETQ